MSMFFHIYPTCPNCYEPNLNGSILSVINEEKGLLKCSRCGVYFSIKIDFSPFPYTWKLMKAGNEEYDANVNEIPFIWNIKPNAIEESYLAWLKRPKLGKYLITWPWDEVKFIPLLISVFALENPGKKVVVVNNFENSSNEDKKEIHKPDLISIFNNLFILKDLNNGEEDQYPEEILREFRDFGRKNLLKQRNNFHYHVKIIKKSLYDVELDVDKDNSVDAENCSFLKCRNRIKNKMDHLYGNESIRTIKWKERGKWEKKDYNLDGYFDVSIIKQPEWKGDLKYKDKSGFWKAITNIDKLYRVEKKLKSLTINNNAPEDINTDESQIIFISDTLKPEKLFSTITTINPEMVIFPTADDFIEENRFFRSSKGKEFVSFIKNTEIPLMMFSVKPDSRHLYEIGLKDGLTGKCGINIHTWDSDRILEKIMDETGLNLDSTRSSNLRKHDYRFPETEYITLKCLDTIEELIPKILTVFENNYAVKRFFEDLIRTSLYIKNAFDKTLFRRGDWDFGNIMSYIMDIDFETYKIIAEPFNKYYQDEENPINPIMNKIVELLTELVKNENLTVLVVVPFYEKKGTEQIIQEKGFQEFIPDQIQICTWNEVDFVDVESNNNNDYFVISTIAPYITYKLYGTQIKKFIFIGSTQNLEKIKIYLDYRLNERKARPIHILSSGTDAPELLKRTFDQLSNVKKVKKIIEEIEFEESFIAPWGTEPRTPKETFQTHHMKINAGENVALLVDENGTGMFLPFDRYVSFIKENKESIEEIKIMKSKIHDMVGKEIIMDDHGFYASYKMIFTRFMVENGENALINTPLYQWRGFKNLVNTAFEWERLLRKVYKTIEKDDTITENKAKEKLAKGIVSLNIHAKDADYIKNHWLAEPSIISTTFGPMEVFEIEHPQSLDNLIKVYEKINELFPEINVENYDPRESYTASIFLQRTRRKFLKETDIPVEYRHLHGQLQEKIKKIINTSTKFKINSISIVKLTKEVYPLERIEDFTFYIK